MGWFAGTLPVAAVLVAFGLGSVPAFAAVGTVLNTVNTQTAESTRDEVGVAQVLAARQLVAEGSTTQSPTVQAGPPREPAQQTAQQPASTGPAGVGGTGDIQAAAAGAAASAEPFRPKGPLPAPHAAQKSASTGSVAGGAGDTQAVAAGAAASAAPFSPTPVSLKSPVPVPQGNCKPAGFFTTARVGFLTKGGGSLVDSSTLFVNCWDIVAYVPRALDLAFLSPSPAQWFRSGAGTGSAAEFSAVDAVLLWILMPGLIVSLAEVLRHPTRSNLAVAFYIVGLGLLFGLAIPNLGTIFRLRLQIVMLGAIFAVHGWVSLLHWISHRAPGLRGRLAPAWMSPANPVLYSQRKELP